MADYTLIDSYLGELRRETRWLRDTELIAEEVADHLLEAVEMKIRRGVDQLLAQEHALTEFGDPALVGRAFASSRTGGATLPTQFTRRAGYALIVSAFLWLAGMGFSYAATVADRTNPWEGLPRTLFTVGAIVLVGAGLLGAAGVLGLNRRHGGSLGLRGRIGFWLFSIAGVSIFALWFWGLWATALGIGAISIGSALARSDIAPRSAGFLVSAGGVASAIGLWSLQFMNTEISIDDTNAQLILYGSILVFAVGLAILGRWMAGEEVVDEPQTMATV